MSLRSRLEAMVHGMPPGSSITVSVDWLRRQLESEPESDGLGRLLTLKEAAEYVGRAVSTVRTWCNTERIQGAVKLRGHSWRIPEEALRRFIGDQARDETNPTRAGDAPDLGSWRDQRESDAA